MRYARIISLRGNKIKICTDIANIALHISLLPICLPYQSNICGASLPEAFRLSTSISGGYSNSSCSSACALASAVGVEYCTAKFGIRCRCIFNSWHGLALKLSSIDSPTAVRS